MASPNNPKSSAQLIREHSKARVVTPSRKMFVTGWDQLTGKPNKFSREMTDADAVESMARKFG
jgi:hypothetical protein